MDTTPDTPAAPASTDAAGSPLVAGYVVRWGATKPMPDFPHGLACAEFHETEGARDAALLEADDAGFNSEWFAVAKMADVHDTLERERASRQQAQRDLEQAQADRNRARMQGERDARRTLQYVIDQAVAAEREACARACDLMTMGGSDSPPARAAARCARIIRARSAASPEAQSTASQPTGPDTI